MPIKPGDDLACGTLNSIQKQAGLTPGLQVLTTVCTLRTDSLGVTNHPTAVLQFREHMNANHIRELGQATLSGALPFGEIVGKLIAEGVEYYHVDYVSLQMCFYGALGGVVHVPLNYEGLNSVATNFDAPALKTAIIDSQTNGQEFREFSRRAVNAGVAGYFAFLRGQRVTYLGRQGDQHVEWFPGVHSADT